ncbi:hypothetical protein [Kordiimonas aquimaris]|uniref:hypothetical protein n=1 Tax=Kordiimonas aquimaris TaxID=707591 RepID=UPI0021D081B7|nr:hypothetical protein [Kordiimonas aquimaris]
MLDKIIPSLKFFIIVFLGILIPLTLYEVSQEEGYSTKGATYFLDIILSNADTSVMGALGGLLGKYLYKFRGRPSDT